MTPSAARQGLVDRVITFGQLLAALLAAYLMVSVVLGVVARSAFGRPQAWVVELAGPAMLGITMLAAAAVARDDGHVRLTLLDEFLPQRRLRQLSAVATVIELVVIALLLYATTRQWWADVQSGTYAPGFLRVERWKLTAQVPLGLVFYLLFLVRSIVRGRQTVNAVEAELEAADDALTPSGSS